VHLADVIPTWMAGRRNRQTTVVQIDWDVGFAERADGSLTQPSKVCALGPGGPLEIPHRRFSGGKLVLLGRLGLKFRRHSPQPARDREIEGGSRHRNQSLGLPM
jgi:hypothetical protein